jgi:hypothetical protein
MESPDDIFLNAREMVDPVKRVAYLDQACGGDDALRACVEAMLRVFGRDERAQPGQKNVLCKARASCMAIQRHQPRQGLSLREAPISAAACARHLSPPVSASRRGKTVLDWEFKPGYPLF